MPDKEDNNTGFSGIAKRIENLKDTVGNDGTAVWNEKPVTSEQAKGDSAREQDATNIHKQKRRFPFRITAAKIVWGVVALVIIVVMFLGNNKKPSEKAVKPVNELSDAELTAEFERLKGLQQVEPNYAPSEPASAPGRWVTEEEFQKKHSTDGKYVTVGQYRCSKYHHNTVQKLLPGAYEEQSIESESSALASLKNEIETDYVDRYSQDSINRHNMLVDDYNSRIQSHKMNIDNYNKEVAAYNNYLLNNCSKAY